jgi:hypothetical protein
MKGVACGSERITVEPSALHYVELQGMWSFNWPHSHYQILVAVNGNSDGPDAHRLDLAERVILRLDDFFEEAQGYLTEFVGGKRRLWHLQALEFGTRPDDPIDEFEMLIARDGDDYGMWGVRFIFNGAPLNCFFPYEFRRTS